MAAGDSAARRAAGAEVSVIIPTYNRRDLIARAIDSVLAQTHAVQEIIVVDDGSSDGTREMLAARYNARICYAWQANAGVSAARNHGLRLATGRFLALLDSDDVWLPEKTALQLAFLQARPDFGMVLCDVERVDPAGRSIDVLRRRLALPTDGEVFEHVLLDPALVPASVLMRREVYDAVGGFDESLATAEDLDFHLRVAAAWPIGVVEQSLVRALRGHAEGLSQLRSTYDDYIRAIERAAADPRVSAGLRARVLARAYHRTARGLLLSARWGEARAMLRRGWPHAVAARQRHTMLSLLPLAARRWVAGLRPRSATGAR